MEQSGFRHDALIYEGAEEFVSGTVPFIRAGLEAGEPVLVAVRRGRRELIEAELGPDAGAVAYADIEEVAHNPALTIPLWRDAVEQGGGRTVRGIGEAAWPGRSEAELEECRRHDALLNVAFSAHPAWALLCPFDGDLPDAVLDDVFCSHQAIHRDGAIETSPGFAPDLDALAGVLPPPRDTADLLRFGLADLALVRERVRAAAGAAGLRREPTEDLVTAANELAANSVMHGGGTGTLRLWREDQRLLVEVTDAGTIEQPLAGRLRPQLDQEGGRGLWLANRLCDLVQVRSGEAGTTVRLHALP
ncbi:MAG TPA: anti-sigma factor RsbA family regulatory protein [Solirubrobacterales bacterium]|nr:anti-sigma factor RsbA family regulatory protein [Solirubrobacterales bacterium]